MESLHFKKQFHREKLLEKYQYLNDDRELTFKPKINQKSREIAYQILQERDEFFDMKYRNKLDLDGFQKPILLTEVTNKSTKRKKHRNFEHAQMPMSKK